MIFRNVAKTFSRRELRFLLRNTYFGSNMCKNNSFRQFTTTSLAFSEEKVKVTFTLHDGKKITSEGKVGDSLLDVIQNNDLNIEGFGACEGTLTCSTCHVILKKEDYDRLPDQPCDEERDMLDLAYGLTDTSRLGCQICLKKELEGLEVQVPETINDARS